MRDYELSSKEIAELERSHRSLRDKRQADRVKAVLALSKDWSAAQIAEILLFDEKTTRHYFDRYQQGASKRCWRITIPAQSPGSMSIR